jgi:hypothetical protein
MTKFIIIILVSCLAALSEAATYYVAKSGNNSNSCTQAQSESTPKLTLAAGAACLAAGDTLYIKAGTYSEPLQSIRLPTASSWAGATTISRTAATLLLFGVPEAHLRYLATLSPTSSSTVLCTTGLTTVNRTGLLSGKAHTTSALQTSS